MLYDDNKIEITQSEKNDYYSDDDIYDFNSWGADLSFRELIERYENKELIKPELQRNYVWDKSEASRFIDSILLKLPVPSIFLAKQDNETLLIIDGYQRLMTVYDYVSGIFSKDNKVFRLSNTKKINQRWRGKAFSELTETEQRRIKNTTIHSIIFVQTHPNNNNTGMYQVFERINTSGRTLYPQEIRNCVYQGSMNDLLFELNSNEKWRKCFGSKEPDPRMRDMEYILRYLTLSEMDFDSITAQSISLKKELNIFMANNKFFDENKKKYYSEKFSKLIEKIYNYFGRNSFHNLSQTEEKRFANKFNPTIYDSFMLAFESKTKIKHNLLDERILLLEDPNYQESIRIRTTNIDTIKTRIRLATEYLFED